MKIIRFIIGLFREKCAYCKEPIFYSQESLGISPPSSCSIHAKCRDGFYSMIEKDPEHQRRRNKYIRMLDNRDNVSKEEWKDFHRGNSLR